MKNRFIGALLLCLFVAFANAQSTARQFTLSNSEDGESTLTVFLPSPERACGKAVVCCPGGGYSHLAIHHEGYDWAEYFNQQGIALIVLKYRMPNGNREIPLTDAYRALQTVRDSAALWRVNPRAVGIMGFSAGGHLASAVSTHAPMHIRPNFSILFYPVISMNERLTHKGSCEGFLGDGRNDEALVKEWSSDKAVIRHQTPPAIIFTANDDDCVPPVTNGIAYYSSMRQRDCDCALHVYPRGGHGFGWRTTYEYHDQMVYDLTSWLNHLSLPSATAVKVACVGNSITSGAGIDVAQHRGYPAALGEVLGDKYVVKNFGVSGRTMLRNGDMPYMIEQAWRDCLDWQPDIVVVKLGTNDSKDHHQPHLKKYFMRDMQELIDSLRALPTRPRIILCSPIPAYLVQWTIRDQVIVDEIIPMVEKMAKKNHLEYIDLHTLFPLPGTVTKDGYIMDDHIQADGIHPTSKGAHRMAELIAPYILGK